MDNNQEEKKQPPSPDKEVPPVVHSAEQHQRLCKGLLLGALACVRRPSTRKRIW